MFRVEFPPGCKPFSRYMDDDELEPKISKLASKLHEWKSSRPYLYKHFYKPLAFHLIKFIDHPNLKIRYHTATCIADIVRAFAPESPYTLTSLSPRVFKFLANHLKRLSDPEDPFHNAAVYILFCVGTTNAFAECGGSNQMLPQLIMELFLVVNQNQDADIYAMIVITISNLISDSDEIREEILVVPMIYMINPESFGSDNQRAHMLSSEIFTKTKKIVQPYLEKNFCQLFTRNRYEAIIPRIADVVAGMSKIYAGFTQSVFDQLKRSIISQNDVERKTTVEIMANLLLATNQQLLNRHLDCFELFLNRFYDRNDDIRMTCVRQLRQVVLHTHWPPEIFKILDVVHRDRSQVVRAEVMMTIMAFVDRSPSVFNDNMNLMKNLDERACDVSRDVRKITIKGLARFYARHSDDDNDVVSRAAEIVLKCYRIEDQKEKFFIEKQIDNWFEAEEYRMQRLLQLFRRIDDRTVSAFTIMIMQRETIRRYLQELLKLLKKSSESLETDQETTERNIQKKVKTLALFFSDSSEAEENLLQFVESIKSDPELLHHLLRFACPWISREACTEAQNEVLTKITHPDRTDIYYKVVQRLLIRSSFLLIDGEDVEVLIDHVKNVVINENDYGSLSPEADRALHLLQIFSATYPAYFCNIDVSLQLLDFLNISGSSASICKVFTRIGYYKHLDLISTDVADRLVTMATYLVKNGTREEVKNAVRLIIVFQEETSAEIFRTILADLKRTWDPKSDRFLTLIVVIGCIGQVSPRCDAETLKEMTRKIVTNVLLADADTSMPTSSRLKWLHKKELPEATVRRLEAMKCYTRWLCGINSEHLTEKVKSAARNAFEIFTAFIARDGDILQSGNLSPAEMAWLRLQAGVCALKICRFAGIGEQISAPQLYQLSLLMTDQCEEVRTIFRAKLNRGMDDKCPDGCLPVDFIGFYVLGGLDDEEDAEFEKLSGHLATHISNRTVAVAKLPTRWRKQLPECAVIHSVAILAHSPFFEDWQSYSQLELVMSCFNFFFDPFFAVSGYQQRYCDFFKRHLAKLKTCKDATSPGDHVANSRIRAVAEVGMFVVQDKMTGAEEIEAEYDVYDHDIPAKYLIYDEKMNSTEQLVPVEVLDRIVADRERMMQMAVKKKAPRKAKAFGMSRPRKRKGVQETRTKKGKITN